MTLIKRKRGDPSNQIIEPPGQYGGRFVAGLSDGVKVFSPALHFSSMVWGKANDADFREPARIGTIGKSPARITSRRG
jgi:hypothetical protein